MYPFKAYRNENHVIINGEHHYRQGEVLAQILNKNFTKLNEKYREARLREGQILYPAVGYDEDYNARVYWFHSFFCYVDAFLAKLPPYNKLMEPEHLSGDAFLHLLSTYPMLFRQYENMLEDGYNDVDMPGVEFIDEYVYEDISDPEERHFHNEVRKVLYVEPEVILTDFTPGQMDKEVGFLAHELNKKIMRYYDTYMTTVAEILRAAFLYSDLLDNYIHPLSSLLDSAKVAEAYQRFLDDTCRQARSDGNDSFRHMVDVSGMVISHQVIPYKDDKGKKILGLWEVTEYVSLGAFLYEELFLGLKNGLLPKRCKNCGKYFLLSSGYHADFCERTSPGEDGKTCREVGARRRYDEKVKNDPVWLAYQRAYKTHYARVSKKKMTKPEFAAWSDFAIDLRDKALKGEVEFEVYVSQLKK